MIAPQFRAAFHRGDTLYMPVTIQRANGTFLDLSLYTIVMYVENPTGTYVEVPGQIDVVVNTKYTFTISTELSETLSEEKHVAWIEITDDAGDFKKSFYGTLDVQVAREVYE